MSEILSEDELRDLSIMGPGWLTQKQLDRIIASHRQLRAERDALTQERDEFRSCNEHHKAQFLQTNAALAAMRKERDALQAELVAIENQQGLAEERRQFNQTIDALKAELAEARKEKS